MVEGDGGLDVELEAESKMVEKGRDGGGGGCMNNWGGRWGM